VVSAKSLRDREGPAHAAAVVHGDDVEGRRRLGQTGWRHRRRVVARLLAVRRCTTIWTTTSSGASAKEEAVGRFPCVAVSARPACGTALPKLQAAAAFAHAVSTKQLAGVAWRRWQRKEG